MHSILKSYTYIYCIWILLLNIHAKNVQYFETFRNMLIQNSPLQFRLRYNDFTSCLLNNCISQILFILPFLLLCVHAIRWIHGETPSSGLSEFTQISWWIIQAFIKFVFCSACWNPRIYYQIWYHLLCFTSYVISK